MSIRIDNVVMSVIEHAASWLVGHLANSTASLNDLTPSSPLVIDALAIGAEAAAAHGTPVATPTILEAGPKILEAATDLSAVMRNTAGNILIPQIEEPDAEPAAEATTTDEPAQLTKRQAAAQAKAEAAAAAAAAEEPQAAAAT